MAGVVSQVWLAQLAFDEGDDEAARAWAERAIKSISLPSEG